MGRFAKDDSEIDWKAAMFHKMTIYVYMINIQNKYIYISLKVHHDLAKYHEMGRFAKDDSDIDWKAAMFHKMTIYVYMINIIYKYLL